MRLRWLPDSMFGRLFVAVCVPIAIMLIVSYALVVSDRRRLVAELGGSNQTVVQIDQLARDLLALSLADRPAAINSLNATPVGRPGGGPPPDGGPRRDGGPSPQARSPITSASVRDWYLQPLRQRLGAACKVSAASASMRRADVVDLGRPPGSPAWIAADEPPPAPRTAGMGPPPAGIPGLLDIEVACNAGAPLVFRVTSPPTLPSFNVTLAWQLLILTVMLAAALLYSTRRITRPLTELRRAADAMGRAMPPPRIAPSGAREIRESLIAFNTMQDRLRRYLDSRTRVLAAMSHDLRTPLTRLRLRAETLEPAALRERLVSDIEEMDSLVNRSLSMFRGLNDDEPAVDLDVNAFLKGIANDFAELGQTVPIQGHATRTNNARPLALKRAIQNLIENAIKYGHAARIEVSDGKQLDISICDSGPGIPASQLEAVFEPFFRLEDSRHRDTGGIGLGLSIARDVAEMHGGTLRLHNISAGGLAATLTLPRTTHRS
jgi:signal transduction histidine kinase